MSKNEKQSLVFFGSGPVASQSLEQLLDTFNIEAVVTKSTTEQEMRSVVKDTPVYCVSDKADLDKLFTTSIFTSSCAALIDFGIIVSKKIIDFFENGIINSHFSLLPELRGADPISYAILEGKKKTGVSLMLLVEAMDEGPVLSQVDYAVRPDENTPTLTQALIRISADELKRVVPLWVTGKISPIPQSEIEKNNNVKPTYTRKLTKKDGYIDWEKPAQQIEREIRAFSGWPKSTAKFAEISCVIVKSTVLDVSGEPSKLFIHHGELGVYCGEKSLIINYLKPAGKKEMSSQSFLAGYKTRLGL